MLKHDTNVGMLAEQYYDECSTSIELANSVYQHQDGCKKFSLRILLITVIVVYIK